MTTFNYFDLQIGGITYSIFDNDNSNLNNKSVSSYDDINKKNNFFFDKKGSNGKLIESLKNSTNIPSSSYALSQPPEKPKNYNMSNVNILSTNNEIIPTVDRKYMSDVSNLQPLKGLDAKDNKNITDVNHLQLLEELNSKVDYNGISQLVNLEKLSDDKSNPINNKPLQNTLPQDGEDNKSKYFNEPLQNTLPQDGEDNKSKYFNKTYNTYAYESDDDNVDCVKQQTQSNKKENDNKNKNKKYSYESDSD